MNGTFARMFKEHFSTSTDEILRNWYTQFISAIIKLIAIA